MEAFVYCWTDHKTNKLYVGSHKGTTEDGYVCSSKVMLEEYNKRPHNFTRQIVAHGTWDDCFKLEGKILEAFNVREDNQFYNMHNGSGEFRNKQHSEETKKKMRGAKRSAITKEKMKKARAKQVISEETKLKMKQAALLRSNTPEGKKRLQSIAHLGGHKKPFKHSEETKLRLSQAAKKQWERS